MTVSVGLPPKTPSTRGGYPGIPSNGSSTPSTEYSPTDKPDGSLRKSPSWGTLETVSISSDLEPTQLNSEEAEIDSASSSPSKADGLPPETPSTHPGSTWSSKSHPKDIEPDIETTQIIASGCCLSEWFQWLFQCFPIPIFDNSSQNGDNSVQANIFKGITESIEVTSNQNMEDVCRDFRRLGGFTDIIIPGEQRYSPPPSSNSMEFIQSFLKAYQTWCDDPSCAINKGLETLNNPLNLTKLREEEDDIKFLMGIAKVHPLIARIMRACAQETTGIWYTPMANIFSALQICLVSGGKSYEISFKEDTVVISQTHTSNLRNWDNPDVVIDSFTVQFQITLDKTNGNVISTCASISDSPKNKPNRETLNDHLERNHYTWPNNYL